MEFPSPAFLVTAYLLAIAAIAAAALAMKASIRLSGTPTWVLFLALGPAPLLVAYPLADLAHLNVAYSLPVIGFAVLVGIFSFHMLLPKVLPDFQTDSAGSSGVLAVLLGLAVFAAGLVTGEFDGFFPFDDAASFLEREGQHLHRDELLEDLIR